MNQNELMNKLRSIQIRINQYENKDSSKLNKIKKLLQEQRIIYTPSVSVKDNHEITISFTDADSGCIIQVPKVIIRSKFNSTMDIINQGILKVFEEKNNAN